ncbi:hypothetical protein UFOVP775_5 [uncultured Caudovirales phage]|uniref:Uncharacterized protein n=1 Tax=uncultured Caudovirales phage TaxID=2100421 RepID=A0A6J5NRH5_9CAUD|nr:hypothetical protein UFOVP775_5 [uncultured Caudovirales phage]
MSIKLQPKQEAGYLFLMMKSGIQAISSDDENIKKAAKFCAWECVDEIMGHTEDRKDIEYWLLVKKEIDKI